MAFGGTEREEAASDGAPVPDWLRIQATPAMLAPATTQFAETLLLAEQQEKGDGVLDEEAVTGLTESGWLRQDVQCRGAFVSTSGLRRRLDHPELLMLNVPSGAIGWAVEVFGDMATYLDEEDAQFEPGEMFVDLTPAGPGAFTFATLSEQAAESIRFESIADEVLLVVPLP